MAMYVFSNHGTLKWLPETIKQITGSASVLVQLSDGCTYGRHIDARSAQEFHDINLEASPTQTVESLYLN